MKEKYNFEYTHSEVKKHEHLALNNSCLNDITSIAVDNGSFLIHDSAVTASRIQPIMTADRVKQAMRDALDEHMKSENNNVTLNEDDIPF